MNKPAEFVEIQVKSVLNKVEGMPFRWSINPYRGCSHACPFCLSGDTLILMSDGTVRKLDEIQIGDQIYGTSRDGPYRRYVRTFVLAHWSVEKPAFRITLEDGTELIASGDHRFLTDRGWKFVTGAEQGRLRRPHMTLNHTLMGTGAFAAPPLRTAQYKRGYLCGIIRGDGLLRFFEYERVGRSHGNVYQFRLALTDREALDRARDFLLEFSVPTHSFVFQEASQRWRGLDAIRTSCRRQFEDIERIVQWPSAPSLDWCRGFLAGIFDAEGSYYQGVLRIRNTDPMIVSYTTRCLSLLRFAFVVKLDACDRLRPLNTVTLCGGLREHLRFFHAIAPAITRKRDIHGKAVRSRGHLGVVAIEPIGVRPLFDIMTGTGDFIANGVVSHNCYARRTHWFLEEDGVDRWSSKIFVKVNAPGVLRGELARRSWKREDVALGTATDPYQAVEARYRVSRRILEALRDFRTPVSIVTRSPLIRRDLDRLEELARCAGVTVCVSIATIDAGRAREIEPTVASPAQRLKTVEILSSAGIRTGVLLAPILPGLTDDPRSLEALVQAARDHKAHFVWHNVLHLGEVTRDSFMRYLRTRHPRLVPKYEQMYRGKYAPAGYRAGVSRVVHTIKERIRIAEPRYLEPPPEPEQMSLLAGASLSLSRMR